MKFPNWHDRPEQFSLGEATNGKLDGHHFIQMADQFISLANKRNRKVDATEIQMVMLFAAARYAAHVGKILCSGSTCPSPRMAFMLA